MIIESYILEIQKRYNHLANEEILNFLNKKIFYVKSVKRTPVFGDSKLKSYSKMVIVIENKTYRECIDFIKSQVTEEEWNDDSKMLKDEKNNYYSTMSKSFWIRFEEEEEAT